MLQRPWRLAIGIVAAILVLLAIYTGWLLWQVNKHLSAASADATSLRASIADGDRDAISARFDAFAQEAKVAHSRTGGPMWSLLTHLPAFGDDARGVQVVSRVAAGLTSGSLKELAGHLGDLDELAPRGGAIDLDAVTRLQQPVIGGADELEAARKELEAEDPSGFVERLKLRYRDLEGQVRDAAEALDAAKGAVQVMPSMLGQDGPKRYLLVIQNNAETRSTGGLPGAVSVLGADHGKLTLVRQVAGDIFGQAPEPVLELRNSELNAYGDLVGTYFLDANMQPDWARASDLMAARWKQVYGDQVDGVVSLDPIALSYLLKVTGPVTVDGAQLSAENVVPTLLHQVYLDHPDPEDQDAYFRRVAAVVFDRLTGTGVGATELLPALRQGVSEHRILLHSFDKPTQRVIAGTTIAGEVSGVTDDPAFKPSPSPQIGVYFNEASASKMSYYLKTNLKVMPTSCAGGVQTFSAHLTLTNTATASEVKSLPPYVKGTGADNEPGMTVPVMQIYGPVDGAVGEVKLADKPDDYQTDITDERRPIKQVWIGLKPGETQDLTWTMKSGKGQTAGAAVSVTPSVTPGTQSVNLASAC